MKKRKLKVWISKLITVLLYGTLGTLVLCVFFYILGSAILQTSYRLNPLTQEEINQKWKKVEDKE